VPWWSAQLAYWQRRAGAAVVVAGDAPGPWASELSRDWAAAAESWRRLGCPYEEALALAEGDVSALRRAHDLLIELGAAPAAAIVARKLRQRGVRGIARGPRAATIETPPRPTPRPPELPPLATP